mmetsp:Transcript_3961/g.12298  ORF Transcript_3961/g.12298 Transcript_3961/m.12298 type:complete len:274 (-) Transcript_3961:698-1519(-)
MEATRIGSRCFGRRTARSSALGGARGWSLPAHTSDPRCRLGSILRSPGPVTSCRHVLMHRGLHKARAGHRAPRRPDIEGSSELQWGEAVSFLRRVHAGFAAAARQLERTAPAHALAALASAFAVTATASRASVARAVDLREAIVASRPAAAAFAGSAFAGWLRGRIADADRRGTAAAPIAWEECVAALVVDHAGRGTGARLAELTARCRIISGRAKLARGESTAAASDLRDALELIDAAGRRNGRAAARRPSKPRPERTANPQVRLLPMRTRH